MNLTANATTNGSKRQKDNNTNFKFSNDQCKISEIYDLFFIVQ